MNKESNCFLNFTWEEIQAITSTTQMIRRSTSLFLGPGLIQKMEFAGLNQ